MFQVTVDAFGGVGTMHSAAWLVTRLHSVDTLRCGKTCRIPKRAGTHGDEEHLHSLPLALSSELAGE